MKVIVAGTVRVAAENLESIVPHMQDMLLASRAEEGCLEYSYAHDVLEPGLIRVFEIWRDRSALTAHFQTEHMARWRAVWPELQVSERHIFAYDVADERTL
jgi:quinol monooxygenase YgiN